MSRELVEKITQLKTIYDAQPEPALLKDKVVWAYARKTLDRLTTILEQEKNVTEALETFLKDNWTLVNGTLLSPTTSPRGDITVLLKDIAQQVASETGKNPIHILMPTVYTESYDTDKYPNLDSLESVLETHCLGVDGQYLIPVKLLLELELTPENTPTPNNYVDMSGDASLYYIQPEALVRLGGHSELTRAIVESKKAYDALSRDKSNLLGQLTELCRNLYMNSVSALGEETNAGGGAYPAIIQFSDYYESLGDTEKTKIPVELKASIEKLLNLSSNKEDNINATENIETCIASRRSELVASMNGQEAILSSIAITGEQQAHLIEAAKLQFESAKQALAKALSEGTYPEGRDDLGLTKPLLDALEITPTIFSLADLKMIQSLSANEIREICADEALQEQIVAQLANLENLVIFIMELAPDKLPAFLEVMSAKLARDFVQTPNDLAALLISLDIEKCKKICEAPEVTEVLRPRNMDAIIVHLSSEQRAVVFQTVNADQAFMLKMVKHNGRMLQYVPKDIDGYKEIAIAAVMQNCFALKLVPKDIAGYQDIVLAAVMQNGFALTDVPKNMVGYKDIVLAAVQMNRNLIFTLPVELKTNNAFINEIIDKLTGPSSSVSHYKMQLMKMIFGDPTKPLFEKVDALIVTLEAERDETCIDALIQLKLLSKEHGIDSAIQQVTENIRFKDVIADESSPISLLLNEIRGPELSGPGPK